MKKIKSLCGSFVAVCIMAAGAIIGMQIVGWLAGMLIWPVAWCLSFVGFIGDICPKSPGQEMLARFAIGTAIMGVLIVKMSFAQKIKRGK